MTGEQCFAAAMNLLSEQEESLNYYRGFALGAINQLLANCRREDRALRDCAGLPPREGIPQLESLAEELPYDEGLVRECFPYGLAAMLICDEDKARFNWLAAEFADRTEKHCPASLFAIEELY